MREDALTTDAGLDGPISAISGTGPAGTGLECRGQVIVHLGITLHG